MSVKLTEKDIKDLKQQGYTDTEIQSALMEIEQEELTKSYSKTQYKQDPRQNSQLSSFSTRGDQDLIRWQLELNDILERAEHILRGDVPSFKDGHIVWDVNPYPEKNALNPQGVAECMKILSLYVNRNTILSDYTNREINFKVFDFSRALNNLIFMRDYEFGMDTDEKRKNYEMLVTELKDIVHSAYKRALDGAEKRSLREMINVTQATQTSANLSGNQRIGGDGMPMKERGLLNPLRYVKGKYV
jgi:hypothetical protein